MVVGVVLVAGMISWLVTRWQVAGGVLRIDTGLIRRDSRRFPLSQVQAIDVVQTGLARVLGLAELRLRMAGGDASGGRLACLPLAAGRAAARAAAGHGPRAGDRGRGRRGRRRGPGERARGDGPRPPRRSGRCSGSAPTGWPAPSSCPGAGPTRPS